MGPLQQPGSGRNWVNGCEPPFSQIKQARGFWQLLLRGLRKARGEWALICLTHNLRKLHDAMGAA